MLNVEEDIAGEIEKNTTEQIERENDLSALFGCTIIYLKRTGRCPVLNCHVL